MKQNISKKINKRKTSVRQGKKSNLTLGMIRIIFLCLFIPYFLLSSVLFYYTEIKSNNRINDTVTTSMRNAAKICSINIESAIAESRKASYDGVIKESYYKFLKKGNENEMHNKVSGYLKSAYMYNTSVSNTILLFHTKTRLQYYAYNNRAGGAYSNIYHFRLYAMPVVMDVAKNLGTRTSLVIVGEKLYVVRNIVTNEYVPFATLIMEINVEQMFKSIDNVVWREAELIYIDDQLLEPARETDKKYQDELIKYACDRVLNKGRVSQNEIINEFDRGKAIAHLTMNIDGQKISYVVKLDKVSMLNERGVIVYAYILLLILTVPLLYGTVRYFYTNISNPIAKLMYASEKIENGEYGYEIEVFHKNKEFGKMVDTFNHMSVSLKDSFNRIYAEEVALRDANIKALQTQINPHFLNNTLEIINWKARMSGNDDVSAMIEALGTMMETTMNRNNDSIITISEELRYVNAYLYIIEQRFGDKFEFSKEIDEKTLDLKIPRLIVQPLVENMVEHGGDKYGNRKGKLRIFEDGKYLHIVVENNGDINEEDKIRIDKLLGAKELERGIHNIGIRNVNLRLKLLYGETCGLTISNPEKNVTISEIMIEVKKLEKAED